MNSQSRNDYLKNKKNTDEWGDQQDGVADKGTCCEAVLDYVNLISETMMEEENQFPKIVF